MKKSNVYVYVQGGADGPLETLELGAIPGLEEKTASEVAQIICDVLGAGDNRRGGWLKLGNSVIATGRIVAVNVVSE